MPKRPLELPEFILLVDATEEEQAEISNIVCSRTLSTLPENLQGRIKCAAAALFSNGVISNELNLTQHSPLGKTLEEHCETLKTFLTTQYGSGALVELCVSSCDSDIADSFLITDVTNLLEGIAFESKGECLLLMKSGQGHDLDLWNNLGQVITWSTPKDISDVLDAWPPKEKHTKVYAEGEAL
jgi:hypothetical protein